MSGEYERLVDAARAVVERWDTPNWKDVPATACFINDLRNALTPFTHPAPAKGVRCWRHMGYKGNPDPNSYDRIRRYGDGEYELVYRDGRTKKVHGTDYANSSAYVECPDAPYAATPVASEMEAAEVPKGNNLPCSLCREIVKEEFVVPSDIWNAVVRPNGRETDKEYLCLDCWYVSLRKWMVSHGLVQQQDRQEVDVLARTREVDAHPRDCACATAGGSGQEASAGQAANVRDRCGVHVGGAEAAASVAHTPAAMESAEACVIRLNYTQGLADKAKMVESRDAAWQAKLDEAKQARVYYQNIVYDMCNWIDGRLGSHVTKGTGIVCGTSKEPNRNVQQALKQIGETITAKDTEIERLKVEVTDMRQHAAEWEEQCKRAESRLTAAESKSKAGGGEKSDIAGRWTMVNDRAAFEIIQDGQTSLHLLPPQSFFAALTAKSGEVGR